MSGNAEQVFDAGEVIEDHDCGLPGSLVDPRDCAAIQRSIDQRQRLRLRQPLSASAIRGSEAVAVGNYPN